jgi:Tol biopolymer transport system component
VARAPDGRLDPVITDFSGANPVQLKLPAGLQFGSGPLSPDGKLVVLEGFNLRMESDHTYIGALANSTVRVLTDAHYIPGDFSPDGKRVLLFKGPDGSPPPPGQLSIVDVGGANLHRLTPNGVAVQCCFNFRWSPDGSKIVFARPDGGLWTVAPDGTGLTEVFHDAAGRWAITPTWSPDGSMILFALDPAADPFEHPVNGLYAIRADGTGLTLILGGSDFKREPIWVEG